MSAEFYALCEQQLPNESETLERQRAKMFQQIFNGDKEKAKIFILATDGFYADLRWRPKIAHSLTARLAPFHLGSNAITRSCHVPAVGDESVVTPLFGARSGQLQPIKFSI
jgi:hypothetical protein